MFDLAASTGHVTSPDGTPIAWFLEGGDDGRPLLLVHGTTADHTTFRRFAPRMAARHRVVSIDRRGRGASGDTQPYGIEREFEDVAAVAAAIARATGETVDVVGHSFGGRCAMGGALLTASIRRVVAYEGAVRPAVGERDPEVLVRLERLVAEGRNEELLEVFLRDAVEMTTTEWEAFRAAPTFPLRVAAAGTVTRELRAGASHGSALERYSAVPQPVLLVIGSESPAFFEAGARTLARRLPRGHLAVIDGARHAAHHTHVDALVDLVESFLADPEP